MVVASVAGSGAFSPKSFRYVVEVASSFDAPDTSHEVEFRAVGDGEVRLYGMALDRAQAGIVVDALGINGAQIFTPLRTGEEHFAEQVRHRAPDLVILAYGTNEALDPRLGDTEYERGLVELLGRIARAAPSASCLLLGPPDLARHASKDQPYAFWPRIAEIVAIQRKVATAAGCAFYDQLEAMGGPGSIIAWVNEPHEARAKSDYVHLTRFGYAQLATSLGGDVLRAATEAAAIVGPSRGRFPEVRRRRSSRAFPPRVSWLPGPRARPAQSSE